MDRAAEQATLVFLVGLIVLVAVLIRALFVRKSVPGLVGFILLGFVLRLVGDSLGLLSETVLEAFEFLGALGIAVLLFRVGLESDPLGLVRKLPRASYIWIGNMVFSAGAGYAFARFLLGIELVPSLVISVALTATSVGVPVSVWRDARRLRSPRGQTLVDVAELDDITAVALMALLFSVLPALNSAGDPDLSEALLPTIASTFGWFVLKLLAFGAGCFLFYRYAERRMTRFLFAMESPAGRMLTVAGIGLVIAAVAEWIGLTLAIGGLFAGLIFSRDPEAVKTEANFENLYELLVPFFFIFVGLQVQPSSLGTALSLGGVLVAAAVLGKLVGAGLPAYFTEGRRGALLIGVSMVPRAEIALVVVTRAHSGIDPVISDGIFAAMVLVVFVTCIAAPLALGPLLRRESEERGPDDR